MLKRFETKRLILRERRIDDLDDCMEMDRDPEVVKHLPENRDLVHDEEKHKAFIMDKMTTVFPEGLGYWTIESKEHENAFVGWILLIPVGTVGPEIEMGWRLKRKFWGNGHASEAAQAVLEYALYELKLSAVIAEIVADNHASIALAEKLGFESAGDSPSGIYTRYTIYNDR
ncbi:GNAT family N-acetyltransferase [Salinicoccus albus]|uniref:GNAT family N-acetyltransferase n=1 Tax=Salinicoccus albus TaxID=418756 RepID=UPI000365FAAE|nr:GNAT family N-acetyltransferase [Salinicoccus albus]